MTKFEEVGQKYQMQAYDEDYAKWSFENSCYLCCTRGLHIDCSKCAIAQAHTLVMAALERAKTNRQKTSEMVK